MAMVELHNTIPSPATTDQAVREPEQVRERQELIQAVKAVNAAQMFGTENELTFVFDRHTGKPVVRIVNRETRELVNQIPQQYLLELAQGLKK
jgi:flagellar protein FlaG